jgi:hypothetical protein
VSVEGAAGKIALGVRDAIVEALIDRAYLFSGLGAEAY